MPHTTKRSVRHLRGENTQNYSRCTGLCNASMETGARPDDTHSQFLSAREGLKDLAHMVDMRLNMELSQAADHAFQRGIFP